MFVIDGEPAGFHIVFIDAGIVGADPDIPDRIFRHREHIRGGNAVRTLFNIKETDAFIPAVNSGKAAETAGHPFVVAAIHQDAQQVPRGQRPLRVSGQPFVKIADGAFCLFPYLLSYLNETLSPGIHPKVFLFIQSDPHRDHWIKRKTFG